MTSFSGDTLGGGVVVGVAQTAPGISSSELQLPVAAAGSRDCSGGDRGGVDREEGLLVEEAGGVGPILAGVALLQLSLHNNNSLSSTTC